MNKTLNDNLDRITTKIIKSYNSDDRIERIGKNFLPSRTKIMELLREFQRLMFPGIFGHKKLTAKNVSYHVGSILVGIGSELSESIYSCLRSKMDKTSVATDKKLKQKAESITLKFLDKIPDIRKSLALDAQAAFDGDPAAKNIDEIIYCYPGFYAITVYRIAHELLKLGVPLMPRILCEYAHGVTGADIHPGATIGKSFFIDHATGVVIGETTNIGNNVKVYQGVTLGAKSFPKDERGRAIKGIKRHPTIKDNVTIYPNATILGGKTVIGKGATIGGNAYIMESVQAHRLVKQEDPRLQVLSKKKK